MGLYGCVDGETVTHIDGVCMGDDTTWRERDRERDTVKQAGVCGEAGHRWRQRGTRSSHVTWQLLLMYGSLYGSLVTCPPCLAEERLLTLHALQLLSPTLSTLILPFFPLHTSSSYTSTLILHSFPLTHFLSSLLHSTLILHYFFSLHSYMLVLDPKVLNIYTLLPFKHRLLCTSFLPPPSNTLNADSYVSRYQHLLYPHSLSPILFFNSKFLHYNDFLHIFLFIFIPLIKHFSSLSYYSLTLYLALQKIIRHSCTLPTTPSPFSSSYLHFPDLLKRLLSTLPYHHCSRPLNTIFLSSLT